MKEGLLINGFEGKISLLEKIEKSFEIYVAKYSRSPKFIEVNEKEFEPELESVHGITITPSRSCLRGHVFIGIEAPDPVPRWVMG